MLFVAAQVPQVRECEQRGRSSPSVQLVSLRIEDQVHLALRDAAGGADPLGRMKMGRRGFLGDVHHMAVDPVQPVVRLARVVVVPGQRQTPERIEVRIAAASRVGEVPQPPNGRHVAGLPADVLHRQTDESAADTKRFVAGGDQLVAFRQRLERVDLLGRIAVLTVSPKQRAEQGFHFVVAGPGPGDVVEFPEFAGVVADEGSVSPAAKNRIDRDEGGGRNHGPARLQPSKDVGPHRIDRIRRVLAGQSLPVALLRAESPGQKDFALAPVEPKDAHAAVLGSQFARAIHRDPR